MSYSFQGRKVLVTGGAGGLGAATVRKFIKCGATIYAIDFNEERLNNLQKELPSLQVVVADLSKWDEARKAVENLGPMDHLVNNAGFAIPASCLETTEEQIDMVFNLNFKAALNLSQVFAKNVISKGIKDATIVNISSIAAISACKELKAGPVYPCSKAALDMLTKSCAVEFGPHGIRVNSVNPTLMDTYLVAALSSEMKANGTKLIERSPMQGILAPEDAADLVLYLSSTCSKMITGSAVPVDGGYLAC